MAVFVPLARANRDLDLVAGLDLRALGWGRGDLELRLVLVILRDTHLHRIAVPHLPLGLELIFGETELRKFRRQLICTRFSQGLKEQRVTPALDHNFERGRGIARVFMASPIIRVFNSSLEL